MAGNNGGRGGFRTMDPAKQREVASKGGKAAHAMGKAHEWDSADARHAGRRGGLAVSQKPGHMAAIGRKGGIARNLGKAGQS